jgi:hypothetical protein
VSPDKPSTATIISNWIPGEDPAAGPNYFTFSQSARYDIYADTNGDGRPTSPGSSASRTSRASSSSATRSRATP